MTRPASPFAPPPARKAPKVKCDTSDEMAEKNYVRARDGGCVGRQADMLVNGGGAIIPRVPCSGRLEVDHVRASGALSKKSVTHRSNMVLLCSWHHKLKTEYGRIWRPLLLDYLARVERS